MEERKNANKVANARIIRAMMMLRSSLGSVKDLSIRQRPAPGAVHPRLATARRLRAPRPPLVEMAVRMEMMHADGVLEEIADFVVHDGMYAYTGQGLREHPHLLHTRPGKVVYLTPTDPRAADLNVTVVVPDPVPSELSVTVPSREHPGLHELVLEVVNANLW